MIAVLLVGGFLVCSLLGMPLAFCFGISAAAACIAGDIPLQIIAQRLMIGINSFAFVAVPGFVLVGEIMTRGGVSRRLVNFSNSLVKHFKGGLSMAAVFAGMIMGGISGSAVADTAALGGALIGAMEKENYPRDFSSAVIAASGIIRDYHSSLHTYDHLFHDGRSFSLKPFSGWLLSRYRYGNLYDVFLLCDFKEEELWPNGKPIFLECFGHYV